MSWTLKHTPNQESLRKFWICWRVLNSNETDGEHFYGNDEDEAVKHFRIEYPNERILGITEEPNT